MERSYLTKRFHPVRQQRELIGVNKQNNQSNYEQSRATTFEQNNLLNGNAKDLNQSGRI